MLTIANPLIAINLPAVVKKSDSNFQAIDITHESRALNEYNSGKLNMGSKIMNVDVVIQGGGMVGTTLAVDLLRQGLTVALIEQHQPDVAAPLPPQPSVRVSAISYGSLQYLAELGIQAAIEQRRFQRYQRLSTGQQQPQQLQFCSDDIALPYLGYMVENNQLQAAAWQVLSECSGLTLLSQPIRAMTQNEHAVQLVLADGHSLTAQVVIGADGAMSTLRSLVQIGVTGWDYQQHCLVMTMKLATADSGDETWQQFTPAGPRAYLPLADGYASLVWYDSPKRIAELNQLAKTDLAHQVRQHFPALLPEGEIIESASFPLTRRHANHYCQGRVALLGDAAHTINPLAGQGVNLGFKDAKVFAATMAQHGLTADALVHFEKARRLDNLVMQSAMDVFYVGFALPGFAKVRDLGLALADRSGPLKQQALKYAVGL